MHRRHFTISILALVAVGLALYFARIQATKRAIRQAVDREIAFGNKWYFDPTIDSYRIEAIVKDTNDDFIVSLVTVAHQEMTRQARGVRHLKYRVRCIDGRWKVLYRMSSLRQHCCFRDIQPGA